MKGDTPDLGLRRGWNTTKATTTANARRKPVYAHDPAAGPQGPPGQGRQAEDCGSQGEPAAAWRVHPRVHHYPEEAELRIAQGRAREADQRDRGHGLHPR